MLYPFKNTIALVLYTLFSGPGSPETLWEVYRDFGFLLNWGTILNALSENFSVKTILNGVNSSIAYSRGEVIRPLTQSKNTNEKGTRILFKPDPEIWEEVNLQPQLLMQAIQGVFKDLSRTHITYQDSQNENERFCIQIATN
jgi:DNA gyrase subunit B